MLYRIALFLHVTGALLLFAAIVIESLSAINFRNTMDLESIKGAIFSSSKSIIISPISLLLILVPGIYMTALGWKGASWIIISFIGMILLGIIGGVLTGKKMKAIKKIISKENRVSLELRSLLNNNSLFLSLKIRTAVFLGIIYLMTVRPDLTGSIVILIVSLIVGFIPIKTKTHSSEVLRKEQKID